MKIIINILLYILLSVTHLYSQKSPDYISPFAIVSSRTGEMLYIADFTTKRIVVYDLVNNAIANEYSLSDSPTGLAISRDEVSLYVTAGVENGKVYTIDLKNRNIQDVVDIGHSPNSPILGENGLRLYINNQFTNDVSVLDIKTKNVIAKIPVLREPISSTISQDDKYLFIANLLPIGPGDKELIASAISVIDLTSNKAIKHIGLPNGSNAVNGITISPDGKYVYATHILARYLMPTTQLERGWMNTNALSIIDVEQQSLLNTVLLDDIDLGAANPWDVKCTADGKYICVSHSGTSELSIIDRDKLHNKLADVESGIRVAGTEIGPEDVKNDLAFLDGIRRRVNLNGIGPRGIALIGHKAYVAEYFSESIGVVNIDKVNNNSFSIKLGAALELSKIRKGELLFHDANLCFQKWQSCSSCHPGGGRSDGLNWDLLNDGIGNPKNSKSLLLSHETPPAMITGVRDKAESAVRAGFKFIQFVDLPEEDAIAIDEYLKSLEQVSSPYRINGKLSESAKKGEEIFITAQCAKCHSGPLYTDLKKYDVGTGKGKETNIQFDTPTIIENWRTAPFLHDGRAADMKEVLTIYNPNDEHGLTSNLSDEEINDLVEFILSQ